MNLVVDTREGVDLKCYDGSLEDSMSCTSLQKLRRALRTVTICKEGDEADMGVLWVQVHETDHVMSLKQMTESYLGCGCINVVE